MQLSLSPRRSSILSAVSILSLGLSVGACSSTKDEEKSEKPGREAGKEAGAPGEPGQADWTMLGYDAQSTYWNRAETKISVETAGDLGVAYTKDVYTNVYSSPLQVAGRIYLAAALEDGTAATIALDAESGDMLWKNSDFGGASSTLAFSDGTLYVHDFGNGLVHALDAEDGTQLWEMDPDEQPGHAGFSSPVVAGDLVVVGGSGAQETVSGVVPELRGFVTAIDRASGDRAWRTYNVPEGATGASVWSTVSVSPDGHRVFATTGNNYTEPGTDTSDAFIAYDASDGEVLWKNQRTAGDLFSFAGGGLGHPDADFGTNPVVFEAEVEGEMTWLVAGAQKSGDASVVRMDNGDLVWTRKLGPGSADGSSGVFNNGAWDGKRLLIACNGATSDEPGSEPKTEQARTPAVLFALDPATGDTVWERQLSGHVMGPITVANGVGFVGADSELQAFNTETGEILFRHDVGATIASAATISNGRVAVGSGLSWLFGRSGTILTVFELQ